MGKWVLVGPILVWPMWVEECEYLLALELALTTKL